MTSSSAINRTYPTLLRYLVFSMRRTRARPRVVERKTNMKNSTTPNSASEYISLLPEARPEAEGVSVVGVHLEAQ